MTEIPDDLRRELDELRRAQAAGERQRARRRGELAADMSANEWVREVARRAVIEGSSVDAAVRSVMREVRPGEDWNLLNIPSETWVDLAETLRRDIPPESEPTE